MSRGKDASTSCRAIALLGIACAGLAGALPLSASAGVGDDFGTRDPAVCPIRDAPSKGAPSMQQVLHYLACDTEKVGDRGALMVLLAEARLKIAPKPRAYDPKSDAMAANADPAQPVYEIGGNFRIYQCSRTDSPTYLADPGHACRYQNFYDRPGLCWKEIGGDWHCAIAYQVDPSHTIHGVAPPRAGAYIATGADAPPPPGSTGRSGVKHRKKHHH